MTTVLGNRYLKNLWMVVLSRWDLYALHTYVSNSHVYKERKLTKYIPEDKALNTPKVQSSNCFMYLS